MEQNGSFFVQKMYGQYYGKMVAYVEAQTDDVYAAQDIVSQAFEHMMHHDGWLKTQDELHRIFYLRMTVQHYYERHLKKYAGYERTRWKESAVSEAGQTDLHPAVEADFLRYCMGRLDKRERRLIVQRFFERRTVRRIAQKERITPEAVYKRLQRVREKLRKIEEREQKRTRIRMYTGSRRLNSSR